MAHPAPDSLHLMWMIADKFSAIDHTMPIRWIQALVYVAQHIDSEDLTQARIAEAIGCENGVLSKYLLKMSDRGGLGLLHLERDPTNDARKIISLTTKGKKLLNDINVILKG